MTKTEMIISLLYDFGVRYNREIHKFSKDRYLRPYGGFHHGMRVIKHEYERRLEEVEDKLDGKNWRGR
jgi:hypothetical protein